MKSHAPQPFRAELFFTGEEQLLGEFGKVNNIVGRKAAKDECARGVWGVLKELDIKKLRVCSMRIY